MSNPNFAIRIGGSSRTCSGCRKELPLTVEYFRVRSDRPSGFGYTCKKCRGSEDKRRDRVERKNGGNGRFCAWCADLKHRRPRHGDCLCGGKYEPVPTKTSADVMREPRTNNTIYPNTNGFE